MKEASDYAELAEDCLSQADELQDKGKPKAVELVLARAQIYATLAVASATDDVKGAIYYADMSPGERDRLH